MHLHFPSIWFTIVVITNHNTQEKVRQHHGVPHRQAPPRREHDAWLL